MAQACSLGRGTFGMIAAAIQVKSTYSSRMRLARPPMARASSLRVGSSGITKHSVLSNAAWSAPHVVRATPAIEAGIDGFESVGKRGELRVWVARCRVSFHTRSIDASWGRTVAGTGDAGVGRAGVGTGQGVSRD